MKNTRRVLRADELAELGRVLDGRTTPSQAVLHGSRVVQTLMVHAALVASDYTHPAVGEYSRLIWLIVVGPTRPASSPASGKMIAASPYNSPCQGIMQLGREIGLHKTERGRTFIVPHPDVVRLLADPGRMATARALFDAALALSLTMLPREQLSSYATRRVAFRGGPDRLRAMFQRLLEGERFADIYLALLRRSTEIAAWEAFHADLGTTLQALREAVAADSEEKYPDDQ